MRKTVLIDSSAWIELYLGSEKGKKVREYYGCEVVISPINVFEVYAKILQTDKEEADFYIDVMFSWGIIVDLPKETALRAAEMKRKYKMSMGDAIILATAEAHKAELITCDSDFRNVDEVKVVLLT